MSLWSQRNKAVEIWLNKDESLSGDSQTEHTSYSLPVLCPELQNFSSFLCPRTKGMDALHLFSCEQLCVHFLSSLPHPSIPPSGSTCCGCLLGLNTLQALHASNGLIAHTQTNASSKLSILFSSPFFLLFAHHNFPAHHACCAPKESKRESCFGRWSWFSRAFDSFRFGVVDCIVVHRAVPWVIPSLLVTRQLCSLVKP